MKKTVFTVLLLMLSAALLVFTAGCSETAPAAPTGGTAGTTEQTTAGETTPSVSVGGVSVGSRDDFFDDIPPAETEKPSTEPSTEPTTEPTTDPSKPSEPSEPSTEPGDTDDPTQVTYEQYEAMTRDERKAFMKNFASTDDFIDWLAEARKNAQKDDFEILDGNEIDLGKLVP